MKVLGVSMKLILFKSFQITTLKKLCLLFLFIWVSPIYGRDDSNSKFQLLYSAVIEGDLKKVKSALSAGANPNIKDGYGWTVLHIAARDGDSKILQAILESNLIENVNVQDKEGRNPMFYASREGHKESVKILSNYNAEIHFQDVNGNTPLQVAREESKTAVLNEFVQISKCRETIELL